MVKGNRVFKNTDGKLFYELKKVIEEFKIPEYVFTDLLKGIKKDRYPVDIKTMDELEEYMYCVAGTVGIAVLKIVNYDGNNTNEIARFTGYAVQMTNILRDIEEDLRMKRIYIPLEHRLIITKSFEIDISSDCFKNLFEFEKNIAISYYKKADEFFRINKSPKLLVPAIMKNIYRELLYTLDFNSIKKNHKISNYKKARAILKSFMETLI